MPTGIYKRSPDLSEKMKKIALEKGYGKWMTGKKSTKETKKRLSEIRRNINNGVTLCVSCHKKTDNYGKSLS